MLDPTAKALAQGKNFAAFTTLLPSGHPSTHVMWVDADDEHVLINTEIGRQKFANVERDPRVAVTVIDAESPYRYAEVRGRVVGKVTGAEARRHIDELSEKYMGAPYAGPITTERVILQIEPERVRVQG
jgi:PPOX class probable F420-dependent enzyme